MQLQFEAPDHCPQAGDVLQAIDKQLGPRFQTRTELQAQGRVLERADGYLLEIDYATASGAADQRRVQAESCLAAAQAAALFLALALAPAARDTAPELQPPAAASAGSLRSELGIIGLLDTALLQPNAWGVGLAVGVQYENVRLSLAVAQWLGARVDGFVSGELSYWSVRLGACYMVGWEALQLGPCAYAELGQMSGYAYGVADGKPGGARVQAWTMGGEARVRLLAPLWFQLGAGFEWVQRRPHFQVGTSRLYQPEAYGLRMLVGPVVVW